MPGAPLADQERVQAMTITAEDVAQFILSEINISVEPVEEMASFVRSLERIRVAAEDEIRTGDYRPLKDALDAHRQEFGS